MVERAGHRIAGGDQRARARRSLHSRPGVRPPRQSKKKRSIVTLCLAERLLERGDELHVLVEVAGEDAEAGEDGVAQRGLEAVGEGFERGGERVGLGDRR